MERRCYGRIYIRVLSCFIIPENEPGCREFGGVIDNISEGGMLIRMNLSENGNIAEKILPETIIRFQAYDEYELLGEVKEEVVEGEVVVVRTDIQNDDLLLGCRFVKRLPKLDKYIDDKKVALFTKNISNR